MDWQPIETAPKDGTRVDLYGKCWIADDDKFIGARFPACYWTRGDSMTNHKARWVGVEMGWHPTHWMPIPGAPPAIASPRP